MSLFPHSWPRTDGDPFDSQLMTEDYYHGLLPREDIVEMLEKNGDFLVRMSIPEPDQPRQFVLSVMHDESVKQEGIRHFCIQVSVGGYMIEDGPAFDSVVPMVNHYLSTKTSITKRYSCPLSTAVTRRLWQLKHELIHPEKKLGEGAFGEVQAGKAFVSGEIMKVAIKLAKMGSITKEQIREFMMEARVMRGMNHPYVVKFYGVAAFQDPLLLVMELVDEGSLDKILIKKHLTMKTKTEFCVQASWGIEYLHSIGLMHRDIAARNCLVNAGKLKISDFGLTSKGTEVSIDPKKKVPVRWMAPGVMATFKYTPKCDVWAYGILCWEIFSDGQMPYNTLPPQTVVEQVRSGYRMTFPESTPAAIGRIVHDYVWQHDVHRRLTMAQISEWLEKVTGMHRPGTAATPEDRRISSRSPYTSPSTVSVNSDRRRVMDRTQADKESKKDRLSRRSCKSSKKVPHKKNGKGRAPRIVKKTRTNDE
ncbi:unnamed protein product [Bursaphelenchus okinawaensis]|uniref:Tyrosine-protein kinase n=1 Tax=Bursaphelenchus okinawaensis TaxID=465554 RepID=A0A811L401_9BILA|nr:unnamed protein product [Bursaphelenchus okinawaensis]CAG9118993.1 unnamed protein product [Bursaphelenchus okinawaensis]